MGRPQMGQQQPFGKLPQIIQAARKGDPRATQMLNRVRKAIDDALRAGHGPKGKPGHARREKSPPPPTKATSFRFAKDADIRIHGGKLRLAKQTGDVNVIDAVGFVNAQAVKKAEIARRKAEVRKAHADMVRREKMAKAHYEKLERKAKAGRKKAQKDDYARVEKLVAESKRLQEEIRRLRAELGAKRR